MIETKLAYITHTDCLLHDMGNAHPESPARVSAIQTHLGTTELFPIMDYFDALPATQAQLARAHDADYLQNLHNLTPVSGIFELDADTNLTPHTWHAAQLAAGAGVLGVRLLLAENYQRVFCNVRPPGHHAETNRAMGFCFLNNIMVAALHAKAEYGIQKIAIIDFDAHHGNGTEAILAKHPDIFYCSSFQHPFYPNTALESAHSNIIKIPLAAGSDSDVFRNAMSQHCLPALRDYAPELILISAGFDGHREDALTALQFQTQDYHWITTELVKLADEYASGRILSMLEGGYHLQSLCDSVEAHCRALAGLETPDYPYHA